MAAELRQRYLSVWLAMTSTTAQDVRASVRLYNWCVANLALPSMTLQYELAIFCGVRDRVIGSAPLDTELAATDARQSELLLKDCLTPMGRHARLRIRGSDCISIVLMHRATAKAVSFDSELWYREPFHPFPRQDEAPAPTPAASPVTVPTLVARPRKPRRASVGFVEHAYLEPALQPEPAPEPVSPVDQGEAEDRLSDMGHTVRPRAKGF
jgi:hypothetical protein